MSPIAIVLIAIALFIPFLNLIHPTAEAAPTRAKITFLAIGIFFVGMIVTAATIDTNRELANAQPAAAPPIAAATDPDQAMPVTASAVPKTESSDGSPRTLDTESAAFK